MIIISKQMEIGDSKNMVVSYPLLVWYSAHDQDGQIENLPSPDKI